MTEAGFGDVGQIIDDKGFGDVGQIVDDNAMPGAAPVAPVPVPNNSFTDTVQQSQLVEMAAKEKQSKKLIWFILALGAFIVYREVRNA